MANVTVKNSATGQTLSIDDSQLPFMSSQWSVVQANQPAPTPAPSPAPAPTQQSGGNSTNVEVWKNGEMKVVTSDGLIPPNKSLKAFQPEGICKPLPKFPFFIFFRNLQA